MSKLTREQKTNYRELKEIYKTENCYILNSYDKTVTVFVFRGFKNSNAIKISTSVCSPKDKPNRKMGKYMAMLAMYNGESISIPAEGFASFTLVDIADIFMADLL